MLLLIRSLVYLLLSYMCYLLLICSLSIFSLSLLSVIYLPFAVSMPIRFRGAQCTNITHKILTFPLLRNFVVYSTNRYVEYLLNTSNGNAYIDLYSVTNINNIL